MWLAFELTWGIFWVILTELMDTSIQFTTWKLNTTYWYCKGNNATKSFSASICQYTKSILFIKAIRFACRAYIYEKDWKFNHRERKRETESKRGCVRVSSNEKYFIERSLSFILHRVAQILITRRSTSRTLFIFHETRRCREARFGSISLSLARCLFLFIAHRRRRQHKRNILSFIDLTPRGVDIFVWRISNIP